MGTTADKLTYLGATKAGIRDAANASLDAIGSTKLTTSDTFRSYADALQEVGVYANYILSDGGLYVLSPSNMYTDTAGTTNASADGDPCGNITDSSGNGYDFASPSDAARPTYKTDGTYHWIQLDKVDDNYSTTFTNNIVGTMLVGTTKGTIHVEVNIPAGAWSMTPNPAWFPGDTVTDIIIKNGVMTDIELANAKAWLASRGSPVVYTPTGTDLSSALRWPILTSVAKNADMSNVVSMSATYRGANITSIPDGYLDAAVNITSASNAFANCPITYAPPGLFANLAACTDYSVCFTGTNLTQTSIDNVLASIRASYTANGLTGGQFDQSGGSTPSAAGEADIDFLRAQGMTVNVTGGY